jgi:hypothetical protein
MHVYVDQSLYKILIYLNFQVVKLGEECNKNNKNNLFILFNGS